MSVRISVVKKIEILSVSSSAIVHIGDAVKVKPRSKTIELERDLPAFTENEADFSHYSVFSIPISQPTVQENVDMTVKNKSPWIKVNQVNVVDISSSSIFQVGSNQSMNTEARYKQIRQSR
ncbi:spore germination protein GerPE [Aneurinibacillus tyrosinisolvens]|uniref:spore germination protein GerPE n=1 Tax=Aneurinibacillus tyrosinisolvens TaxID=1443435 RepID=UPI00063F8FD5|nr:spore germination protein GerPE [Aneurinibacillus tyrosinisolvens]